MKGERWCDVVRLFFPGASMKECEYLLWEQTVYPLADRDTVAGQLAALARSRFGQRWRRWRRRQLRRMVRRGAMA